MGEFERSAERLSARTASRYRFAGLGGATAGLAISGIVGLPATSAGVGLAMVALLSTTAWRLRPGAEGRSGSWPKVALVALLAGAAGLLLGVLRLQAIDAGAFDGRPGSAVQLTGFLDAVPQRDDGIVRLEVETADGRVQVEVPEPVPDMRVGAAVAATGVVAAPQPWLQATLRRHGIARVIKADRVQLSGAQRGGLTGLLDEMRANAEQALDRGVQPTESALARGFVLGQDDRIPATTENEFRRAGLSHLLAVSGQNVMLLAALALPLLALLGTNLRGRLLWLLALIAIYVPVAGGGPSIQRAGVMGAVAILAALVSRPQSRAYALLLAALVTLALNPLSSGDIGWQLSFAAVAGIALWARPLANAARRVLRSPLNPGARLSLRTALAEGFGVTAAATIATGPLLAHHFEAAPLAALPANLLVLPAVAPVMWLGMLTGFIGQLPLIPVEPLNFVSSLLIAYIEQVAHWFAAPSWALVPLAAPGWAAVGAIYALMASLGILVAVMARRRRGLGAVLRGPPRPSRRTIAAAAAAVVLGAFVLAGPGVGGAGTGAAEASHLRVSFLDVGQGDAILVDPPRSDPLLVDGGPPGDDILRQLESEGVSELAAIALSHDQSDHSAGLHEVLGSLPVGVFLHGDPAPELERDARAAGVPVRALAAGDQFRLGQAHVEVLWPPPSVPPADDPNLHCLVLLVRWREFTLLLTGDAEAEAVPIDTGQVDVLKVAHHGSDDEGLPELLDRARPQLAVISVGEGNPFGHPTPDTLGALEAADVPTLRTDRVGEVDLIVTPSAWAAETEGG